MNHSLFRRFAAVALLAFVAAAGCGDKNKAIAPTEIPKKEGGRKGDAAPGGGGQKNNKPAPDAPPPADI